MNWWRLETTLLEKVPPKPGVYIIRWIKDGKPTKIGRLKGIDPQGILYIGSTKNLKRRISTLIKSLENKNIKHGRINHTMVKSYIFFSLSNIIKISELEITWIELDNTEEAQAQELSALKYYGDKFGELPPLNLKASREMIPTVGLAKVGKARVIKKPDYRIIAIIDGQ
jgi:hypothetical protein